MININKILDLINGISPFPFIVDSIVGNICTYKLDRRSNRVGSIHATIKRTYPLLSVFYSVNDDSTKIYIHLPKTKTQWTLS